MTRKEFLIELDRRLSVLPREEADKHLAYYAEILADRVEDGMTDEEAVASLESLDTITGRILGQQYTTPKRATGSGRIFVTIAVIVVITLSLIIIGGVSLARIAYDSATNFTTVPPEMIPVVDEIQEYESAAIPSDGIENIDINWISETVSFMVWDESEILLETYSSEPSMEYEIAGNTLVVRQSDDGPNSASCPLTITLPRTLAERSLNELTIFVTSAYVDLFEINAEKLTLTTISGECNLDGFFGDVNISTTSGDIFFYGSFENGTFNAVSGCFYLTADGMLRSLSANSVSGEVSLSLPVDTGFTLEFDSVSGSFYSGNFGVTEKAGTYTHGNGEVSITVDTVSGDLILSEY